MFARGLYRYGALVAAGALLSSAWAVLPSDDVENVLGTMDWTNAAGWSTGNIPGVGQRAIINNGTLTIAGTNALGYLSVSGSGALTGSGTLVLQGTGDTSLWTGGVGLTGLTLEMASGAQLAISGASSSNRNLDGASLTGPGTVNWTGGLIRTGNDALIAVGTFIDATHAGTLNTALGGPLSTLRVESESSFVRDGTGTSTLNVLFENFGQVDLVTGNLRLQGGSVFHARSGVNIGSNTELRLGAGGTDVVHLDGFTGYGTLVVDGAIATFHGTAAVVVVLANGSIGGTWAVADSLEITGGHFQTGLTEVTAGNLLSFKSVSQLDFSEHVFRTLPDGIMRWHSGDLRTGQGGGFDNQGQFTILHAGDRSLLNFHGGTAALTNTGTLHKHTGTGTTTINVPVTTSGEVIVESGELRFQQAVTFPAGPFALAGGTLRFDQTLSPGTDTLITGQGTLIGTVHTAGAIEPADHLSLDGNLTLLVTSRLIFALNAGDGLSSTQLTVTGTLTLGGELRYDFVNPERPAFSEMVVLASATSLAGDFANVAPGGRLFLPDGQGSFEVHYGVGSAFGARQVVLTHFDFTPIPEPTTAVLLLLGLGWLILRRPGRTSRGI
jgi:hypothetical protein